jgi:hypothetical protein
MSIDKIVADKQQYCGQISSIGAPVARQSFTTPVDPRLQ